MSKESEPIRSRRDLRRESGQQEQASAARGNPAVPLASAPKIPAPVDKPAPAAKSAPAVSAPADSAPARRGRRTGEQQGSTASAAPGAVPAASAAPAAPAASVDEAPRERSSQTRARDRATLRAYKELAEPAPAADLPSRRAMRIAQLEADRAPITSVNQIVPPARVSTPGPATSATPIVSAKAPATSLTPIVQARPAAPKAVPTPAKPTAPVPTAAAKAKSPVGSKPMPPVQAPRTAMQAAVPAAKQAAPVQQPAEARAASRSGRRSAPLAAGKSGLSYPATTSAVGPGEAARQPTAGSTKTKPSKRSAEPMSVEAALAARNALVNDATSQLDALAGPAAADPLHVDLEVLAQQRALAERAAVLNRRAADRERLAQEGANSRPPVNDPTSAHNLAMVTPLEFIRVPGVDNPVLRPPSTSHVPVITRSTPRQQSRTAAAQAKTHSPLGAKPATASKAAAAAKPAASAPSAAKPGAPAARKSVAAPSITGGLDPAIDSALAAHAHPGTSRRPPTGHTRVLKRAEAVARGGKTAAKAPVERTEMPPLPAESAHGLEPLDAITAGLGRTQRNRLIQWGSIAAGAAALIAGIAMIISSLAP